MGQVHDLLLKGDKIEQIARGDFMDTLALVMPYLLERREVARWYCEQPNEHTYQLMQHLNKEISEILNLF